MRICCKLTLNSKSLFLYYSFTRLLTYSQSFTAYSQSFTAYSQKKFCSRTPMITASTTITNTNAATSLEPNRFFAGSVMRPRR